MMKQLLIAFIALFTGIYASAQTPAVDYTVDPRLEAGATGKASQIIRVGMDGEVEILRA